MRQTQNDCMFYKAFVKGGRYDSSFGICWLLLWFGKIHTVKSMRFGGLGREHWRCGLPGTGQDRTELRRSHRIISSSAFLHICFGLWSFEKPFLAFGRRGTCLQIPAWSSLNTHLTMSPQEPPMNCPWHLQNLAYAQQAFLRLGPPSLLLVATQSQGLARPWDMML